MKLFKTRKEGEVGDDAFFVFSKHSGGFSVWINFKSYRLRTSVSLLKRN